MNEPKTQSEIIRSLRAELSELREYKAALEWVADHIEIIGNAFNQDIYTLRELPMDFPDVLRQMIEKKERT